MDCKSNSSSLNLDRAFGIVFHKKQYSISMPVYSLVDNMRLDADFLYTTISFSLLETKKVDSSEF